MREIKLLFILLMAGVIVLNACTKSVEEPENDEIKKPVITFDAEEDIYRIKISENLLLEPNVEHNENAVYRWIMDNEIIGTDISHTFISDKTGQFFVRFEVSNSVYTVDKEIRIDVLQKLPPVITMVVPEEGFLVLVGSEKEFTPTVLYADNAEFEWILDDERVADTKDWTFSSDQTGDYTIVFRVENADGNDELTFNITVCDPEDIPFSWEWERDDYRIMAGRTLVLAPLSVANAFNAVYTWKINGEIVQEDESPEFSFASAVAGEYELTVTMDNEYVTVSKIITVIVSDNEEDLYLREITEESDFSANKVWEFLPAPGQFTNEDRVYINGEWVYTFYETMEEACAYAEERLAQTAFVSLGAFGGYITVGFDHSVVNDGGYNLQILGNAFDGSSEPGIVWVMQDENGDGLPNDTWYELKGSEHGKPETIYNYAVTYYRPESPQMDIYWTDNHGNDGFVEWNIYHRHDSYYPNWVKTNSYTLRGTRLQSRTVYSEINGWRNEAFEWGYADNYGSPNTFRISDAVDQNGNPVELKYIDFVKIQTGVQAMAGILGEVSTEVLGVRDYNMIKE
ncbi:MAG: cell surface protein [Rikenellaceae bacterium]|nr:cell surface protein [Rikenellaceae bacterium]